MKKSYDMTYTCFRCHMVIPVANAADHNTYCVDKRPKPWTPTGELVREIRMLQVAVAVLTVLLVVSWLPIW
jgi:hypothetical protein